MCKSFVSSRRVLVCVWFIASIWLFCCKANAQARFASSKAGFTLEYDSTNFEMTAKGGEGYFWLHKLGTVQSIQGEILETSKRSDDYEFPPHGSSLDSLFSVAVRVAKGNCLSDGDDGSGFCKDPVSVSQYKSKRGLGVVKFYLWYVYQGPRHFQRTVGPFFCVDVSRSGRGRALFLQFYIGEQATPSEEQMLDRLIDSIVLTR